VGDDQFLGRRTFRLHRTQAQISYGPTDARPRVRFGWISPTGVGLSVTSPRCVHGVSTAVVAAARRPFTVRGVSSYA
jgi:hypothetical protein